MILAAAARLVGSARVRACWLKYEDNPTERIAPVMSHGRAKNATTVFKADTPYGYATLQALKENRPLVCEDVDTNPPAGWTERMALPTRPEYKSFLAVPVVLGDTAYGMLTVDSVTPNDLSRDDLPLVMLMAGLLAAMIA